MKKIFNLFVLFLFFVGCKKEEDVFLDSKRQEELEDVITVKGCLTKEYVGVGEEGYKEVLRLHIEVDYSSFGTLNYAVIGYIVKVNGIGEDLIYATDRFSQNTTVANIDVKEEYLDSEGIELVPFVEVIETYGTDDEKIDGIYTIYGNSTIVNTDLSYNSRIDSIYPLQTDIGETITIAGKGFCVYGLEADELTSLLIGGIKHPIIYKSDSILKVELSSDIKKRASKPVLENCGLRLEYPYSVEIKQHSVTSVASSVFPGDEIIINGTGFKEYTLDKGFLSILLKDSLSNYYNVLPEVITETRISAKVPFLIPYGNMSLGVVQLEDTILANEPTEIKSIVIKDIVPDKFHIGDTIEIFGDNFLYDTDKRSNTYVHGLYNWPENTYTRGLDVLQKTENYIKAVVNYNYLIDKIRVYNRINDYEGESTSFYDYPIEVLKPNILTLDNNKTYNYKDDLLIEFKGRASNVLFFKYGEGDWEEDLKHFEIDDYLVESETVLKARIPMTKFYNSNLLTEGYEFRIAIHGVAGLSEIYEIELEKPTPYISSINKDEFVKDEQIVLTGKDLESATLLLNNEEYLGYVNYTKDDLGNDLVRLTLPNSAKPGENEIQFIHYGGLSNVVRFSVPGVKINSLEYLETDSYGNAIYNVYGENLDLISEYTTELGEFSNDGDKQKSKFLLFKTVFNTDDLDVDISFRSDRDQIVRIANPYRSKFKPLFLTANYDANGYPDGSVSITGRDLFFELDGSFYHLEPRGYDDLTLYKFNGSEWESEVLPNYNLYIPYNAFAYSVFKYYEGKIYTVYNDELIFIDVKTHDLTRLAISDLILNDTTTYSKYKDSQTKRYVYSDDKLYIFIDKNSNDVEEIAMYRIDLNLKEIKEYSCLINPIEGFFPEYLYVSENHIFCTNAKNKEIYYFNFNSEKWNSISLPDDYPGGDNVRGLSLCENNNYLYLTGLDVFGEATSEKLYEASLIYKYDLGAKSIVKKIAAPHYKKVTNEVGWYSRYGYRSMYDIKIVGNRFYLLGGVLYMPYIYNSTYYKKAAKVQDVIEIFEF